MGERKIEEVTTYKIKGVEIFSAGTWNKDKYSIEDLHNMVTAFHSLKGGFLPYIKLGHDNSQKLAKSSGLPSIGWVENVYVRGDKLLADFDYIPEKIYQLIKSRAYRKVSCEIYSNLDFNGTTFNHVLGAVALLGAEAPGVLNLDDILGKYTLFNPGVFEPIEKQDNFKQYSINLENFSEDEMEELEKIKSELEEHKKNYAKLEEQKNEAEKQLVLKSDLEKQLEKEREDAKLFKLEIEKNKGELQKLLEEKEKAHVEKFTVDLEAKKLISPSMKELVTELMSNKKEFSIKEKKYTKEELIAEILTLSKENAKVNFDESSRADFEKGGDKKDKTQRLDEMVSKYAKDHNVSYGQALKAVSKSEKIEEDEE